MDFTQRRVGIRHDFGDADPPAPTDRSAVVVPMTGRDVGGLAAERLFESLATLDLSAIVVPVRSPADRLPTVLEWVREFDVPLEPVWCNGPGVEDLLEASEIEGPVGKGRDVWIGLGLLDDVDYVAFHDADVRSHETRDVRKLLSPLADGASFSKGYYARVENERLYGRLLRLLYEPLVETLDREHDADVLTYLGSFRYALAGEFATTIELARSMRLPPRWGLEVGTLGEAYRTVGFPGTVQVDLGRYEHDHRAVSGPDGLSKMASGVAQAIFRTVEAAGVEPAYEGLRGRYRTVANEFVDHYGADARFNGLTYDELAERDQVRSYATAIEPPGPDHRLPAWEETSLDPDELRAVVAEDLNRVQ
ncbi:MAG: glycosyl transferase family 2 [Halanaeroarchaeum sp.]